MMLHYIHVEDLMDHLKTHFLTALNILFIPEDPELQHFIVTSFQSFCSAGLFTAAAVNWYISLI
jgi:hypothetical protein